MLNVVLLSGFIMNKRGVSSTVKFYTIDNKKRCNFTLRLVMKSVPDSFIKCYATGAIAEDMAELNRMGLLVHGMPAIVQGRLAVDMKDGRTLSILAVSVKPDIARNARLKRLFSERDAAIRIGDENEE